MLNTRYTDPLCTVVTQLLGTLSIVLQELHQVVSFNVSTSTRVRSGGNTTTLRCRRQQETTGRSEHEPLPRKIFARSMPKLTWDHRLLISDLVEAAAIPLSWFHIGARLLCLAAPAVALAKLNSSFVLRSASIIQYRRDGPLISPRSVCGVAYAPRLLHI